MRWPVKGKAVLWDFIIVFVLEIGLNDVIRVINGQYTQSISGILVEALLSGRFLVFVIAAAVLGAPGVCYAVLNQRFDLDRERGWLRYVVGLALGFLLFSIIPSF